MSVGPDGASEPGRPANSGGYSVTFDVQNTGTNSDFYSIACTGSGSVTCTGTSTTSLSIGPGGAAAVAASYSVGAVGTGTLILTASGSGVSDEGSYSVPVLSVSVSPDGEAAPDRPANTTGHSATFTITNAGTTTVTFTVTCSGSSNVTCTGTSASSVTLGPGASTTVTASYGVGVPGTGELRLTAQSGTASDAGSYIVPVVTYGVSVTSSAPAEPERRAFTGPYARTFEVTNTGSGTDTYAISCSGSSNVTCTGVSASTVTLSGGATAIVGAGYTVGAAGNGTLTLTAASPRASASGSVTIPVIRYAVAVTPDGTSAPERLTPGSYAESFTVQNTGNVSDTYTLACSGAANVTCRGLTISGAATTSVTLAGGGSSTVVASYSVGAPGMGSLSLTATGNGVSDGGSYTVPVVTYGVVVTPDGASVTVVASSPATQAFTVQNTGSVTKTFTLTATCSGAVSGCSAPAPITVSSGTSAAAVVTYQAGTTGTTGTVQLTAVQQDAPTVQDAGSVNVTAGSAAVPVVDANTVNPGAIVERDLCLTIRPGAAAAYECGDLRIVHALPTTRTLNKARTPTLLYNSGHAHPYPLVAANVTLPAGSATPDSVVATLRFGTIFKGRGKWAGSDWVSGASRRIVVGYDGLADTTGIYAYTLEVVNWYGSVPKPATGSGQLAIVNWKDSPFGTGWWLAGLERLSVGDLRWVGGDGSVRQYTAVSAGVFAAPSVDRPDTLKQVGTEYVRLLPHGVRVWFDATGKHVRTVNRLQQVTTFGYDGCGRLGTITLPPASAARVYQFTYASATDCTTRLASVTAPPAGSQARTTTLTVTGGQVSAIRDPDGASVSFGYDAAFANRVSSRTDRRGFVTSFTFDAGKKLSQASLNLGAGQPPITNTLRPLESQGLASAVDTSVAVTRLDGPRTDVADTTLFWLDRFGAPRKIVNALGFTTTLTRGDARWPALVTELRSPNGFVTQAAYDARGNIVTATAVNPLGDGRSAVTRYEWDPAWDFVTKVVPPERDSTVLAYDPGNGNRLYQQDARGTVGRVEFFYYATGVEIGLLRSLRTPGQTLGGPRDSLVYGAVVANLFRSKTPLGFWTTHYADALGRDTLVVSPTDSAQTPAYEQRQRVLYDLVDQDTLMISIGSPLPYRRTPAGDSAFTAPETLFVRKYFDREGNLDSLRRRAQPNPAGLATLMTTRYRYDGGGRRVAEVSPDGKRDSTAYDPAGNAVLQVTRLNDTLRLSYDALNRARQRLTPAKTYAYQAATGSTTTWHFPMYRADASGELNTLNGGTAGTFGLTIAADTATFAYDSAGNVRTANNRDAQITRTYNPNGTLATETERLRTYVGVDFTQHGYTLRYAYDLDGRRTALYHPPNLAPAPGGVAVTAPVTYHYNTIGQLDTLVDVLGGRYAFAYDLDGRLIQAGGEQRFYDPDGRIIRREDGFHSDTLRYNARGKVLRAGTRADSTHTRYMGLGAVAWSQTRKYFDPSTHPEEQYVSDALGNTASIFRRVNGTQDLVTPKETRYAYDTTTGRLLQQSVGDSASNLASEVMSSSYDAAGNQLIRNRDVITSFNSNPATLTERTRDYYGADGKVRVADRRTCIFDPNGVCQTGWGTDFNDRQAFEEYRYDALGRRVLLRSRGEWGCVANDCRKLIQRFVWDGDQLLYEVSAPGGTAETAATMERDVNQPLPHQSGGSTYYTGRVAYTHGLGLDAPLALTRMEYSDLFPDPFGVAPAATWRGDYDAGAGLPCTSVMQVGPTEADTTFVQVCAEVQWPAPYLWITKLARQRGIGPVSWMGSLIENKRDLTGQFYMRNRYYDPAAGRFTQEDPIGLAGGLNLYGFANGDPVNFSDPFGLCPPEDLDPCSASDYYAIRIATGQGSQLLNEIGGALASCGESLLCNAVLDVASLGATALERRVATKAVEEGIYEFTATSGKTYVGQSGRITERLAEHVRAGRLAAEDVGKVARTEVRGSKVAREIAEQRRIDQLGGIKSGKLANKRNPIGPERRHLMEEQ